MVYICVFEYESTNFLGVSFQQNAPPQYPAPGVKCLLSSEFPDDVNKQNQFIDYLNNAFPGNRKNLFNTTIDNIEKLLEMIVPKAVQQQQQQQQQQQSSYMPIGYIIPRPTRNDDSEYSRTPVSSFSFANHVTSVPVIQQSQNLSFIPAKTNHFDTAKYNFKQTHNSEL